MLKKTISILCFCSHIAFSSDEANVGVFDSNTPLVYYMGNSEQVVTIVEERLNQETAQMEPTGNSVEIRRSQNRVDVIYPYDETLNTSSRSANIDIGGTRVRVRGTRHQETFEILSQIPLRNSNDSSLIYTVFAFSSSRVR